MYFTFISKTESIITMKKLVYDPDLNTSTCMLSDCAQCFPQHYHNYYTILLNLKGTRSLTCFYDKAFSQHVLSEGMFMLLNPYEVHQCHLLDTTKTTFCSFCIPTNVMLNFMKQPKENNKYLTFKKPTVIDEDLAAKFLKFQYQIIENPHSFYHKNLLFNEFMSELTYKYTIVKPNITAQQNLIIFAARDYIKKNYHKNFTIEQMCRYLNIKISTLFFHFNREFGISPQRYVMNMRIIIAKQLLKNSIPISNVALQVGFYDHSHFTNFFKRIEGITPLDYCQAFWN